MQSVSLLRAVVAQELGDLLAADLIRLVEGKVALGNVRVGVRAAFEEEPNNLERARLDRILELGDSFAQFANRFLVLDRLGARLRGTVEAGGTSSTLPLERLSQLFELVASRSTSTRGASCAGGRRESDQIATQSATADADNADNADNAIAVERRFMGSCRSVIVTPPYCEGFRCRRSRFRFRLPTRV